jgi:hypothetical protein
MSKSRRRLPFCQQAVSVNLRRRNKQRVVKSITGRTDLAMRQKPAGSNGNIDVDQMDSVSESCDKSLEPLAQRVSTIRTPGADSLNRGLKLDEGRRREVQGILMCLDPSPQAGSLLPIRRQTFEHCGVDQPGGRAATLVFHAWTSH